MKAIDHLAVSLGRTDEAPNIELAERIAATGDRQAVRELVGLLQSDDRNVRSDSIKAIHETGDRRPDLIAPYWKELAALLKSKHGRLVWGAMAALDSIAREIPKEIHSILPDILQAVEVSGSVIARDHAVRILVALAEHRRYAEEALSLLIDIIRRSPVNQLPSYAEHAVPVLTESWRRTFIGVLTARLEEVEQDSKRRRVEKVLRKVSS